MLLVSKAGNFGLARSAGVDINGVVVSLHVEANLLLLVLLSGGGHLGSVQRGGMAGYDGGSLNVEVDIINAKLLVKALNLLINLRLGDETSMSNNLLD
jgi:hypothetical protein